MDNHGNWEAKEVIPQTTMSERPQEICAYIFPIAWWMQEKAIPPDIFTEPFITQIRGVSLDLLEGADAVNDIMPEPELPLPTISLDPLANYQALKNQRVATKKSAQVSQCVLEILQKTVQKTQDDDEQGIRKVRIPNTTID